MKKSIKAAGVIGLLGCAAISSSYGATDDAFWYLGGNIGQSRAKIDDARIAPQLPGTASINDNNKSNSAYKLFGGYQFNRNFAVEGGYFNLGEFGYNASTQPPALAGTLNGKIKLQGLNLDAVGMLPLADRFSVFGRLGLQYAQAKDSFSSTGVVAAPTNPSPSKNALNYKAGLGVQYDFNRSLGMRLEAERYRIDDAINNKGDIDLYSIGLVYRFDQRKPAPVEKVVMPESKIVYVATPAPPAPPAEIIFVTKVVFSADSDANALFTFGKTALKPTGKRALDKFAAGLQGAHYKVITVTGNTDRIGSKAANMRLSIQRAEVVKDYLVESAAIPADKILVKGAGESNPLTKPGECKGNKATRKLVACLAPDRRVEVDVTGTRPAK